MGRGLSESGQTTTPNIKDRKSPPFPPDLFLSQDPLVGTTWAPSEGARQATGGSRSSLCHQDSSHKLWSPLPPAELVLLGGGRGSQSASQSSRSPCGCPPPPSWDLGAGPGFWPKHRAVDPKTPLRSSSRVVTASYWSCLLEEASGRQNLPESFLFGNLEPAPL